MTVCYQLTVEDMVAFQRHLIANSVTIKRQMRVSSGCVAGAIALGGLGVAVNESNPALLVGGAVCAAVAWWLMMWAMRRGQDHMLRRIVAEGTNRLMLGLQAIALDDDWLTVRTPVSETRIRPFALERVAVVEGYVFVYISTTSSYVVPRHGVSDGDFDVFREAIRLRWERVLADRAVAHA